MIPVVDGEHEALSDLFTRRISIERSGTVGSFTGQVAGEVTEVRQSGHE